MNDDTVEGACILMNKIGYIIDDRRKKEESKAKPTSNLERLKEYDGVYKRFEELVEHPDLSQRIKILIKNMLDNRASDWDKSRKEGEKGPKKVEELRKELVEKQRAEQEKLY